MTKIDMVNAQVGSGGNRVTNWAFSRRICVKTAVRVKTVQGTKAVGGSRVRTRALARNNCVKSAVRVNKVQGTKDGKEPPSYQLVPS